MISFLGSLERFVKRENSRSIGVAVAVLLGGVYFASTVNHHYPFEEWLALHYLVIWGLTLAVVVASFAAGLGLLERVFRVRLPLLEHAMIAFALGLLSFEWAMFLLGAVQAYRKPTFFVLPVVFIVLGSDSLRGFFARTRSTWQRARPPLSLRGGVSVLFGCAALGMIYFTILTPDNVQFDSLWKHMALAEDYVAHGGIRKATEGWIFAARPHFTSYLYSWAFLFPNARLFDRMVLGAHLEFATFTITTVLGISALVRRLIPNADPRFVWAARFLFPGVFLYDSSLSAGTDHFGAMYAPALALVLFRALRELDLRFVALLSTLLAGTVLTKETTALLLLPFPVIALVVRAGLELVRQVRTKRSAIPLQRLWRALALGVGIALLVTSPFWLKNWVLYGDPLYPNLARFFSGDPWSDAVAYRFKWAYSEKQMWAPSRDWDGLLETFKALFSYSFIPNDWARSHGKVPVFGSLFTLLLVALPFLSLSAQDPSRKSGVRRIWLLVIWIHVGIFAWYSVHHQDRYLQGIVPLMAAAVAAILLGIWQTFGGLARTATGALVAFQVVWGGDVYFIQTHAMIRSPVKKVLDLISAGYEKKYEERFETQTRFQGLGARAGKGARVLVHEYHPHLGLGTESVLDSYQWQFGIDYGRERTPEGVRSLLRRLGVTHVAYQPGKGNGVPSLASDVLFHEFVKFHALEPARISGWMLVKVPEEPSNLAFRDRVLVMTCRGTLPASGLYALPALDVLEVGPNGENFGEPVEAAQDARDALRHLSEVDWVVVEPRCLRREIRELTEFEPTVQRRRDKRELWRRKPQDSSAGEMDEDVAPEQDDAASESSE